MSHNHLASLEVGQSITNNTQVYYSNTQYARERERELGKRREERGKLHWLFLGCSTRNKTASIVVSFLFF